ncbi:MAG: NAD-dependent DNA ligase LigA [Defluviitaleaceae bacterium]|nr:NAD-dependent DNA ligase LigA [Defluviitaleaceae bacterium]
MQNEHINRIRELTATLNQWRYEYYALNEPTVSDAVYDRYFDELAELERKTGFTMSNSPTQTVGYEAVDGLDKTTHTIPLLSLDKTKDMNDLMRFIGGHQVILMHKLDGLTVKLEYEGGSLVRASTRGNGDEGEVITHNARAIEGIPARISYRNRLVVVGEVYITKPTFDKLKETLRDSSGNPYKNARNMAAGSIRCHDAKACAGRGLVFSPFGVIEGLDEVPKEAVSKYWKLFALGRLGFSPCRFIRPDVNSSGQIISNIISNLRTLSEAHGFPIDGIVVTYDDIPFSQSCGRTGHHYKDGLAFKFEDDLHETNLRGIEWQPSRNGELSPVALFDSVEIDGCEVSRATLHNLTFITELELMPGCRVLVSKRNMIIPHIEDNLDRGRFDAVRLFPLRCPSCDSQTRIKETENDRGRVVRVLRCDNAGCGEQRLRRFVHFVGKKALDIEGLSEATLEKFIPHGWLKDFTDIYRLDRYEREVQQTEGFGTKSWTRLWDAIQRSRATTFERFVISMDIPMVGRTASKELGKRFDRSLAAFEAAVADGFDFTRLDGFGETLHRNIHEWFTKTENQTLWKELQDMTTIENKPPTTATTTTETSGNPFDGRTIVVTGKLNHFTRDSINARIESLGAKAGSAVSKATDYLIAGDKAGSKLGKAQSLGVPVLSEQQFLQMAESA